MNRKTLIIDISLSKEPSASAEERMDETTPDQDENEGTNRNLRGRASNDSPKLCKWFKDKKCSKNSIYRTSDGK